MLRELSVQNLAVTEDFRVELRDRAARKKW